MKNNEWVDRGYLDEIIETTKMFLKQDDILNNIDKQLESSPHITLLEYGPMNEHTRKFIAGCQMKATELFDLEYKIVAHAFEAKKIDNRWIFKEVEWKI